MPILATRRPLTLSWRLALLMLLLVQTFHRQTVSAPLKRPLEPIAARLEPTRTVTYKQVEGRRLQLHLFEPEGHKATDRRPVFLVIHGGGWTGGDARRFYPIADYFRRQGMLGISLEYRLLNAAEKTTVFDCVKDGRSAVRFLRSHVNELGADPHRIVVAGGSAGGHVAAGTALFDNVNEDNEKIGVLCRPDVLVLYYPVIDTSADGYGQKKIGNRWKELSPVEHVRAGLPPTILFHGTADTVTPYAGAQQFHQRMQQADNHCRLISHPGGRHGYFLFDLSLFEQAMQQTTQFLQEQKILEPAGNVTR